MLVRTSEISDILDELLASGRWERSETLPISSVALEQRVFRIKSLHKDGLFMTLWTEAIYHLSVDGENVEVPDCVAWNPVLIEELYHPDPENLIHGPSLSRNIRHMPPYLARSSQRVPIWIPTVPRLLDALINQAQFQEEKEGCGLEPLIHISNFIRYLFLEEQQQRKRILPKLSSRNGNFLEARLGRYIRKPPGGYTLEAQKQLKALAKQLKKVPH